MQRHRAESAREIPILPVCLPCVITKAICIDQNVLLRAMYNRVILCIILFIHCLQYNHSSNKEYSNKQWRKPHYFDDNTKKNIGSQSDRVACYSWSTLELPGVYDFHWWNFANGKAYPFNVHEGLCRNIKHITHVWYIILFRGILAENMFIVTENVFLTLNISSSWTL